MQIKNKNSDIYGRRIVASLATYPAREQTIDKVILSLMDQVDLIYVFLDKYSNVPEKVAKFGDKVFPIVGGENPDYTCASGKMSFLEYEEDDGTVVFICDDDILFPEDYVSVMMDTLGCFNYKVGLGVHASIFPENSNWYYEKSQVLTVKKSCKYNIPVHMLGSGSLAFALKKGVLNKEDYKNTEDAVDFMVSKSLFEAGIPLLAIHRKSEWVKMLKYEGLWQKFSRKITHHTSLFIQSDFWKYDNFRKLWRVFLEGNFVECNSLSEYIDKTNIDPNFVSWILKSDYNDLHTPMMCRLGDSYFMTQSLYYTNIIKK